MSDHVVHLQSIRIEAPDYLVNKWHKGDRVAISEINAIVKKKLTELIENENIGEVLVEDIETDEQ